jgi:hypothetical protein
MRIALIAALAAVPAVPAAAQWATDGWFYANDIKAPNVTRAGDKFMFTFAVIAASKGTVTKPVTIQFTYTQMQPGSQSNSAPTQKACDPQWAGDCDKTATYKTVVTLANVKPGERRTYTLVIGDPAKPCKVSFNCRGSAVVSFKNDNGIKPTMTVKWSQSQNGDANALDVTRTNPKG